MTDGKRPVGRPRTTLEDLPDGWEDIIMEAATEGASALEIRCLLGIGDSAWETLLADYEEFRLTVKNAKSVCEVWWEKQGRKMTTGESGGNATVWIFNMKNRFGWKDKTEAEISGPNGGPINHSIEVSFVGTNQG